MIQPSASVIVIPNDQIGLTNFLRELAAASGASADLAQLSLSPKETKELAEILQRLVDHPLNTADGGVKAKIGPYQFPLRRTIYTALTLAVTFTGGVIAAISVPVAGGIALAGTVLTAVQRAGDLFTKLAPDEVVIYEALGSALLKKREAGEANPRATAAEVEQIFDERNQAPPEVAVALQVVSQKGAIKVALKGGKAQYWIEG